MVALVALLAACNRGAAEGPQGPPVMPVKVQKIGSQELGQASEYTATIKSRNSATIMSDVEGWIVGIFVHSGDVVKQGQSLMEIDPRRQAATVSNWESQRAAKEATLQLAKVQLDRAKGLFASGVVSRQDLDQAQSTYDAANADVKSMDAQIEQQNVQLRYFKVHAQAPGIVGDIPVHVGDRVSTTTVLTTIDERSGLEVYLSDTVGTQQGTETRRAGRNIGFSRQRRAEYARDLHLSAGGYLDARRFWRKLRWTRQPTGCGRSNW